MVANKKVSCIIPAYNESGRIGRVLDSIQEYQGFDEIIIVDDCSQDNTYSEALLFKSQKIKIIRHESNQGKAKAIYSGLEVSCGDLIFLLDADLFNISHQDLDGLLLPFNLIDKCMTMAIIGCVPVNAKLAGVHIWSGQRVIPRVVLEDLKEVQDFGYAIESFLNDYALRNQYEIISVKWDDVSTLWKHQKIGIMNGLKASLKMRRGIWSNYGLGNVMKQNLIFPFVTFKSKIYYESIYRDFSSEGNSI